MDELCRRGEVAQAREIALELLRYDPAMSGVSDEVPPGVDRRSKPYRYPTESGAAMFHAIAAECCEACGDGALAYENCSRVGSIGYDVIWWGGCGVRLGWIFV